MSLAQCSVMQGGQIISIPRFHISSVSQEQFYGLSCPHLHTQSWHCPLCASCPHRQTQYCHCTLSAPVLYLILSVRWYSIWSCQSSGADHDTHRQQANIALNRDLASCGIAGSRDKVPLHNELMRQGTVIWQVKKTCILARCQAHS